MNEPRKRPLWAAVIRAIARACVTVAVLVYTLMDELLFPIFRPLIAWLTRLRLFQRIGEWLGRLPPYAALVALGIPFLIIEPAKVISVWWIAMGHLWSGTVGLFLSYALSLLICERIFHAAYGPLMRIGWFARLLNWMFGLRDGAIAWAKSTAAWQAAARLSRRVRAFWRQALRG